MNQARPLALLAVAALHGGVLAALWPAQRLTAPAVAEALHVKLLPAPTPRGTMPPAVRSAAPALPTPAVAWIAPPAFEVQAAPRPVVEAAPVVAAATVVEAAAVTPAAAPRAEPAEPAPLQSARRAACAPAAHPPTLRERGIEGVVRLRVWVDELGRAGQVLLAASSGWRLFDDAAVAQARRCPFQPALRGTEPVGSWVEFPVRFALETSSNG